MVTTLRAHHLLVLAFAMERAAELVVSRGNEAWLRARGAREVGRGHYPVMVALHAALLAGSALEPSVLRRRFDARVGLPALAVALGAQALRWWCIRTLGRRWTTRVLVLPGAPRIRSGPYRALAHPNYVAVIAEGAALPLVHGAWLTSVFFTAANAALLSVRIRTEEAALERAEARERRGGSGCDATRSKRC